VRRVRETSARRTRAPRSALAAINLRQVKLSAPVRDGDEVAFLPPVAAGDFPPHPVSDCIGVPPDRSARPGARWYVRFPGHRA